MPTATPFDARHPARPAHRPVARTDRRPGRGDGHAHPELRARRGRLPRRALRRPRARPARRQRPPVARPPRHRARDPRGVSRCRGGHHRDEHLHREPHRPGRLRDDRGRPRDEPRGRPPRADRRGPGRGGRAGPAAVRDGRAGPDQPDGVDLARRRRPGRSQRHLRRARGRVPGGDRGPRRRRRRPPGHRDDLRHAQREGRDLRRGGRVRCARRPRAHRHLRHDHRRVRPDAVRTDRRGVLDLGDARPADRGRAQLRAGRAATPRPHRRPRADRGHPGERLPERRAAQRVRRLRRAARDHRRAARPVRPRRARQHRRRLLRHDAGARPGDRGGRRRRGAARDPGHRAQDPAVRPPGGDDPAAGRRLRQRRRADQRDRLAQVRPAHPRGPLRRGRRDRPPTGRCRSPARRREHGRGDARLGRGDDPVHQPDRVGAGHQRRPGHARLIEMGGHRSRAQVPPGQGRRQLDLAQGGRGAVPRARAAVSAVWCRRRRHGLRRAGPGRHRRAQGRDRDTRLSAS